jgi:uncharacterized protein (DUF1330 family)
MATVRSEKENPACKDPAPSPVEKAYILEAVWFHKGVGAQHYREYLEHASPIACEYGARRVDALFLVETLRGELNPDYVCVIEWPSIDNYYAFLKDVHYRAVAAIKEQAVAKVITLHCRRVT